MTNIHANIDTRCANPEYQLDVDTMLLEYVVYKAIEAKLECLRSQIAELSEDASDEVGELSDEIVERRKSAARLHHICNDLILLFRHHHPDVDLNASCNFNIKILEFLILLETWIPQSSRTLLGPGSHWMLPNESRPDFEYPCPILDHILQRIYQERMVETVLRRNWLDIHYFRNGLSNRQRSMNGDGSTKISRNGNGSANGHDQDIEMTNADPARLYPRNIEAPCLNTGIESKDERNITRLPIAARNDDTLGYTKHYTLFAITLFELMPYFMSLSSTIAQALGDINDSWIDLACKFMWHSALERLQQMPYNQYTKPSDTPFQQIREDFGSRVWVEECFAWGSTVDQRPSSTSLARIKQEIYYLGGDMENINDASLQERLDTEDSIAAMLTRKSHSNGNGNGNGDSNTNSETDRNTTPDEGTSQRPHQFSKASTPTEFPLWTQTRHKTLNTLLDLIIEEEPISDNIPFYHTIRKFTQNSPIKPFLGDLLQYIESVFRYNVSNDISGRPVLVQIEEGGIDGLNGEEFEAFLRSVGLKVGDVKILNSNEDSSTTDHRHLPIFEKVVKWAS